LLRYIHFIILSLFTRESSHTTLYMCPISPTKCCPNFALCEIGLTKLFASLCNKAEFIVKDKSEETYNTERQYYEGNNGL